MAIDPIIPGNLLMLQQTVNSLRDSNPAEANALQTPAGAGKAGSDFGRFLQEALQKVDELQKEADVASFGLATGQIKDLHTAVLAMEKAGLSLSFTVEVRNRALDAYHEVMRMQI